MGRQSLPLPSKKAAVPRKLLPSKSEAGKVEVPVDAKKKRRAKSGKVALREIKREKESQKMKIPKAAFIRLAREIAQSFREDIRWKGSALEELQEHAEEHLTMLFNKGQTCAMHRGKNEEDSARKTLLKKDMRLAQYLYLGDESCGPKEIPWKKPTRTQRKRSEGDDPSAGSIDMESLASALEPDNGEGSGGDGDDDDDFTQVNA